LEKEKANSENIEQSTEKSKDKDGFIIVSGVDDTIVATTDSTNANMIAERLELAVRNYFAGNDRYASVFEGDASNTGITLARIDELAVNPQNSISKTREIANIVDYYIIKNYLIGMVDTLIRSNLNTNYKVSYNQVPSEKGRNNKKKLENAKRIVEDMLDKIDVKKLIRISIPATFDHGNYFFYMDFSPNQDKYTIHIFPLSIARVAPYRIDGEPVLMIDMTELKNRLEHNLPKKRGGKAYFFQKYEEEITKAYPKEIVDAFRNKDQYAVLDYRRSGVMRAGEDADGASLYGISQIFRALRDVVILDKFAAVDDSASTVKAKNILVQILRKDLLGPGGDRKAFNDIAFAHGELSRAVKNKICVYTASPAVEDVKWIEPRSNLIDRDNVTLYENRVLTTLGIGFLASGSIGSTISANISLKQLMRQINYISQQLEHILEKFAQVALEEHGIEAEYMPRITVIDSEQLEADMRIDLAKTLYADLGASRRTTFEILGIDLEDEMERRQSENEKGLNDVFTPYMTAYTNSANNDNEGGRPADKQSNNETKQVTDKERNQAKNGNK
jgi:hypothetical protein